MSRSYDRFAQGFRRRAPGARPLAPRLSTAERHAVGLAGAQLAVSSWWLGGMWPESQWVALCLGLLNLALVFRPRSHRSPPGPSPTARLLRLPVFWLGLALWAWVAAGALNPAWTYQQSGRMWWLERVPGSVGWLPAAVDGPYGAMNAWRWLVIFAAPWASVCALWATVRQRRALRVLLIIVAANGALLGFAALLQWVDRSRLLLWLVPAPVEAQSWGSFAYSNHAAAFLYGAAAAAFALAHQYLRQKTRLGGALTPLWLVAGTVALLSTLPSGSRAGALAAVSVAGAAVLLFAGRWVWRQLARRIGRGPARVVVVAAAAVAVALPAFAFSEPLVRRAGEEVPLALQSERTRVVQYQATAEMLGDRWLLGWGAGSYRYLFPVYQRRHPELLFNAANPADAPRFHYAHNDWLQFPAELGAAGAALLLGLALWPLAVGLRHLGQLGPLTTLVGFGVALTLVHAGVDFVLHNPAVLTQTALLLTVWALYLRLSAGNYGPPADEPAGLAPEEPPAGSSGGSGASGA